MKMSNVYPFAYPLDERGVMNTNCDLVVEEKKYISFDDPRDMIQFCEEEKIEKGRYFINYWGATIPGRFNSLEDIKKIYK